ncbi:hypothetical protein H9649_09925 [Sporosarcina sp. Sa2YVA2]|uniref:DUF4825 domain-containing protein n=1 Tax=Sporosarcina quadrami TaxID=2762234 RepID=A0ABR8UA35_9BACL|nr:hypothetical protein [Sporosarcina quadrami]MBD7984902.1 hypothetical protein [Sporosarcina quadrami]
MNKIDIPAELSDRSKRGVTRAGLEMKKSRKRLNLTGISIAAALFLSFGAFLLIGSSYLNEAGGGQGAIGNKSGEIFIPAIKLPKGNTENMDMVGLIVYKGKVYTQTNTKIKPAFAKTLVGEKIGVTKGNIDEWSSRKAYGEELASTIPRGVDVYTVVGYDSDFRIMIYIEHDGETHSEFYENLNGITISSGADLFGQLNMIGNVSTAYWRTRDEWYNSIENFKPVTDTTVLNAFVAELNNVKPKLRKHNQEALDELRNSESAKELTIHLEDGTTVELEILGDGYILYGAMDVYFEMDEAVFADMWDLLQVSESGNA